MDSVRAVSSEPRRQRIEPSYSEGRLRDPRVADRQSERGVREKLMELIRRAAMRSDNNHDTPSEI